MGYQVSGARRSRWPLSSQELRGHVHLTWSRVWPGHVRRCSSIHAFGPVTLSHTTWQWFWFRFALRAWWRARGGRAWWYLRQVAAVPLDVRRGHAHSRGTIHTGAVTTRERGRIVIRPQIGWRSWPYVSPPLFSAPDFSDGGNDDPNYLKACDLLSAAYANLMQEPQGTGMCAARSFPEPKPYEAIVTPWIPGLLRHEGYTIQLSRLTSTGKRILGPDGSFTVTAPVSHVCVGNRQIAWCTQAQVEALVRDWIADTVSGDVAADTEYELHNLGKPFRKP
jgi:hypothetical protein